MVEGSAGQAALFGEPFARCDARGRFGIERARRRRGTALRRQPGDRDDAAVLAAPDRQFIADVDGPGRLRANAIDLDLAAIDRLAGEAARPEEARSPQPDVEPDARRCPGVQSAMRPRRMSQYITQSPRKL